MTIRPQRGRKYQFPSGNNNVVQCPCFYLVQFSVRLNQHAETIQAQYKLVQQQRDDLLAKLSTAEDRESKNLASLTNLQCALEQFQKSE